MDLEATVREIAPDLLRFCIGASGETSAGEDLALEALEVLSPRDREALLLAAAGDLPFGEAARILGVSLSAFKMRVHRAREQLSRQMEKQG